MNVHENCMHGIILSQVQVIELVGVELLLIALHKTDSHACLVLMIVWSITTMSCSTSGDEAAKQRFKTIFSRAVENVKTNGTEWREHILHQLRGGSKDNTFVGNNDQDRCLIDLIQWPDYKALGILVKAVSDPYLTCEFEALHDELFLKKSIDGAGESQRFRSNSFPLTKRSKSPESLSKNSSSMSIQSEESYYYSSNNSPPFSRAISQTSMNTRSKYVPGNYPLLPSQNSDAAQFCGNNNRALFPNL